MMKIVGNKINLRTLKRSDAQSIFENAKDKEISQYTNVPHPYTLKAAKEFIKKTQKDNRLKKAYYFGIEDKKSKQIIGMIDFVRYNKTNKNAEVGYWLGKRYWRQGIMKEALGLLLDFGFNKLKLHRISATVIESNIKSKTRIEKAGFKYEGKSREHIFRENKYSDLLMYGILKKEYEKQ